MTLIRLLAAALLLAGPALGQTTISDMEFADVTISSAPTGVAAPDWTSYFVAIYDFESSGDPWANHTNASGGANCDATVDSGTPTRETGTGDYVQGTASGYGEDSAAQDDTLIVSCSEIELDNQDVTMGGWFRFDDDGYSDLWGRTTVNIGVRLTRNSVSDAMTFEFGNGTTTDTHTTATDSFEINQWYHFVCWFDYSASEADCYIDGGSDGAATSTGYTGGADRNTAYIWVSNGASDKWADEPFKYAGILTQAEAARIGACGIDGSECTCNGATWVNKGKVDANCTDADIPYGCCTGSGAGCVDDAALTDDCNKAAP
jgi:hypothetical protein